MRSFSAIVPNFNDGARIGGALASLAAQRLPFQEIIVVDDASTDDSVRVIEAILAGMKNARLVRNTTNLGVVGALNVGMDLANGDYLFMASANDRYAEKMIEWAAELLAVWPETVLLCGNSLLEGDERVEVKVQLPQRAAYLGPSEILASARTLTLGFASGACIVARPALRWAGGLDPALRWNSDWFVYCLLALTHGCCVIPRQLATVEGSRASYSRGVERWPEQRLVTAAFLDLLRTRFPEQLPLFRAAAVLPRYGLRELSLVLGRRELRPYLTPLLAWRCLEETRRVLLPSPIRAFGRQVRERIRDGHARG